MAIEIREVSPLFGAEICGIDLAKPVDCTAVDLIWRAIDRYAVLVFRDQHLDDTQLRDFASNSAPLRSAERPPVLAAGAWRTLKSATFRTSTKMGGCASATTGGASTASVIGYGIPMPPTCRSRSYSGCSMRWPYRRRVPSAAARLNSPICVRLMTHCPRR
jgi:Taurine catabolism dioxygenase TauD, TfdA family